MVRWLYTLRRVGSLLSLSSANGSANSGRGLLLGREDPSSAEPPLVTESLEELVVAVVVVIAVASALPPLFPIVGAADDDEAESDVEESGRSRALPALLLKPMLEL